MRRIGLGAMASLVILGWGPTMHASAQSTAGGGQVGSAAAPAYGGSVAVVDGDVLVGEPGNMIGPGAVYVYRKGAGGWEEVARLRASAGHGGDGFGSAMAADGGRVLVSARPQPQVEGTTSVYVFERSGEGDWSEAGRLPDVAVDREAAYASSLALQGSTALVGAPALARGGNPRNPGLRAVGEGAVHVFGRADGTWTEEGRLAGTGGGFGASLSVESGRLLVGAPLAEGGGAVFSYRLDDGGWQEEGSLPTRGLGDGDGFGTSTSVRGGRALVSAPGRDQAQGAVFVYELDPGSGEWSPAGQLLAFDGFQSDGFGSAVALAEDQVWIGSPRARDRQGAAYVFSGAASEGWAGAVKLARAEPRSGDGFGAALDVRAGIAVVGSAGADYGVGTAAIFERGEGGWSLAESLMGEMEQYTAVLGGQVDCSQGAATAFECADYDLVSFLPVGDMGVPRGVNLNDLWGWTDPETGREYAIAGRRDGTSFIDVTDPLEPRYLGQLLRTEGSPLAAWRDIKVYANHAYIVADGSGLHGIQVFDLTQLRDVTEPVTFEETAHYDGVASVHNLAINEETGFLYSVGNSSGGETCGGGIHIVDLAEPANPQFAGCFSQPGTGRNGTGYTHDAQCVTYRGPDEEHQGKQICFGSNETAFSIADVTDPQNTEALGLATYPDVAYTHQGWLTEDQRYFFQGDELDEGGGRKTRTLVWDVSDLDDPQLANEFWGTHESTDHNMYTLGNLLYQSNNRAGLRVLDISDPVNPVEVGYFDTAPHGDNGPGSGGSWSNYPYFESGNLIVTSRFEGLFILKKREPIT